MAQVANASSRKNIPVLLDLLHLQAKMERAPGFSRYLGFSPERPQPSLFRYEKNRLDFRYKLSHELALPTKADTTVTLSTYLAILDEVTTWASMASQPKNPRPGVTVNFKMDWGPAAHLGTALGSEVDIAATVTKTGRNLGFIRAEVRDRETGQLVCFGSHTKFMPLTKPLEFLMSPWGRWGLNLYAKYMLPKKNKHRKPQEDFHLSELFTSLQFESPTIATFTAGPQHFNGLGGLHGGCQAILMELMARQVAATELVGVAPHLDSIQVSYQSTATKQMRIEAEILVRSPSYVTIRLLLQRMDGTLISEGILSFANSTPSAASTAGKGRISTYSNAPSPNTATAQRTMSTIGAQPSCLFQSRL
jgi:acyl-coenzyme A thioesterase PaaI-like protein